MRADIKMRLLRAPVKLTRGDRMAHSDMTPLPSAVGITVKSGWAAAVVVRGPGSSPRVVENGRIDLSDPEVPDSRQPYHAGFGTARAGGRELSRLVSSVRRFGGKSVRDAIRRYRAVGHDLRGAGVVVGSLIDPDTIANDHIRIHALEGRLFRRIVEDAAARANLRCSTWRERDLYASSAAAFKRPEQALRDAVNALGDDVAGPWRAEQKMAALAAWLMLRMPLRAFRSRDSAASA